MSGSTLEIRYADAEVQALARRMQRILSRSDTSPLMQAIGATIVTRTMLRFERGQGPGGVRWQESLRAQQEGGSTLVAIGRLQDSINKNSMVVTDNSVEVGTNVEYAAIHQFGGVIRPKKGKALRIPGIGFRSSVTIPARPFLGIDGDDERGILDITDTWIKQKLGMI